MASEKSATIVSDASQRSENHYIAIEALTIVTNANSDAHKISVTIQSGAIIKVYYSTVAFFNTGTTGDYKNWLLRSGGSQTDNVYIGNPTTSNFGKTLYFYARINETSGYADLIFSIVPPSRTIGENNGTTADDLTSFDESGYYTVGGSTTHYIPLGIMTYAEDTGYTLNYDPGKLGTNQGTIDLTKNSDLFELEAQDPAAETIEYWIVPQYDFKSLVIRKTLSILTGCVATLWGVIIKALSVSGDVDTASESDASTEGDDGDDTKLSTIGWIKAWVRTHFVRKHTTETQVMQGDLQSPNLEAKSQLKGNTLSVTDAATIGGTVRVEGKATFESDIEQAEGKKIASSNFQTRNYSGAGMMDVGAAMFETEYTDENGDEAYEGHVITDYMDVRKAAYFRELTIDEVKHVGGELILSQAACTISRVDLIVADDGTNITINNSATSGIVGYRCYFEKEANGKAQYNEWLAGDLARCQSCGDITTAGTYQNVATKYYWRKVLRVHAAGAEDWYTHGWTDEKREAETEHFIDLSNAEDEYDSAHAGCTANYSDTTSNTPETNDNIVLLGSQSGVSSRTTAQVYSTVEANAPSRRYYHGITSFALGTDKQVEVLEFDATAGVNFPHWKVGDSSEYIDFSHDGLKIVASTIKMGAEGKTVQEAIDEATEAVSGDVQTALANGFTVHEQETTDNFVYPTPNDYDADGDGTQEYINADMDAFTKSIYETDNTDTTAADYETKGKANLGEELGNYFLTTKGLLFCLVNDADGNYYWHIVTDKYLIAAVTDAELAQQFASQDPLDSLVTLLSDGDYSDNDRKCVSLIYTWVYNQDQEIQTLWKEFSESIQADTTNVYYQAYAAYDKACQNLLKAINNLYIHTGQFTDAQIATIKATYDASYITPYKEARQKFLTAKAGRIADMDLWHTQFGNYFEYSDGNLKVREEGGIVTTANYAEMYAKKVSADNFVTSNNVVKGITVQAETTFNISHALLSGYKYTIKVTTNFEAETEIDFYVFAKHTDGTADSLLGSMLSIPIPTAGKSVEIDDVDGDNISSLYVKMASAFTTTTEGTLDLSITGNTTDAKAFIKTTVEGDKSLIQMMADQVEVTADKIDLRGETVVTGILRNGLLQISNDTTSKNYWGKCIEHQARNPILNAWHQGGVTSTGSSNNQVTPAYHTLTCLNLNQIGNLTYIPTLDGEVFVDDDADDKSHINLILPSYDPDACYPGHGISGLATNDWMDGSSISEGCIYEWWKVYATVNNIDMSTHQWNANTEFANNIEAFKNYMVCQARQWIGTEITIITKHPLRIFGGWLYVGDAIQADQSSPITTGRVSTNDPTALGGEGWNLNWLQPIETDSITSDAYQVVSLKCVHTNAFQYQDGMAPPVGDCVYWEVRVSGYSAYSNDYMLGKEFDFNAVDNA